MEVARKNIKIKPGETISIYFIGDVHEGSGNHAEKEYDKAVKIIDEHSRSEENVYWGGIGDYIDAINHKDPRFNPAEIARKYEIVDLANLAVKQTERFYERTKPIFNNCLFLLYGNHEEAYVRHNGFDAVNLLQYFAYRDSKSEEAPPVLGYTGFITFAISHHGKYNVYHIALSHGAGGGGFREGYGINKAHDVFRWINADCYIMGHIHRMMTDTQYRVEPRHGGGIIRRKSLYGTNGCFMHKSKIGTRGYFEGKPSPESSIGMLRLDITPAKDIDKWEATLTKIEL